MLEIPSENQQAAYRLAFVRNCLILIVHARERLNTHSLATAEEPHITGELVKSAKVLLESPEVESWMEHIEVLDDPPQNAPNRYGKKRPRIDIEFVTTGRGRRPRFLIEAKRLYRSDSVSEYFGAGGLQMFVQGQYAAEWPSAGMLGYVQSATCATWLERLAVGLADRRTEIACGDTPEWKPAALGDQGLESVRVSRHQRTLKHLGHVEVFHLLLDFGACKLNCVNGHRKEHTRETRWLLTSDS